MSDQAKKNAQGKEQKPVPAESTPNRVDEKTIPKPDADMPIEEYRRRLAELEQRNRILESDNAVLRECVVRLTLERTGVLR